MHSPFSLTDDDDDDDEEEQHSTSTHHQLNSFSEIEKLPAESTVPFLAAKVVYLSEEKLANKGRSFFRTAGLRDHKGNT